MCDAHTESVSSFSVICKIFCGKSGEGGHPRASIPPQSPTATHTQPQPADAIPGTGTETQPADRLRNVCGPHAAQIIPGTQAHGHSLRNRRTTAHSPQPTGSRRKAQEARHTPQPADIPQPTATARRKAQEARAASIIIGFSALSRVTITTAHRRSRERGRRARTDTHAQTRQRSADHAHETPQKRFEYGHMLFKRQQYTLFSLPSFLFRFPSFLSITHENMEHSPIKYHHFVKIPLAILLRPW